MRVDRLQLVLDDIKQDKITKGIDTFKKISQPSKSEDLIGFIREFMNWVATHLANRKLCSVAEKKMFLKEREGLKKKGVY